MAVRVEHLGSRGYTLEYLNVFGIRQFYRVLVSP